MNRVCILAASLAATTALGGCTTMGGNIKGNFSCVAPDGICAPSSTIDDRALRMISGEDGDRMITPAGPYPAQRREDRGYQTAAAAPARTRERVLRIVFPAQIDAAGRLHEQTAIHAVVEQGDWPQALVGSEVATTPAQVAATIGGDTLLAAVERVDPPVAEIAGIDPDLPSDPNIPSAAAVAAARARAATSDPVGDIKDQVARRLSAQPQRQAVNLSTLGRPLALPPAQPVTAASTPAATATALAAARVAASATHRSASLARTDIRSTPVGSAVIVPRLATSAGKAAIGAVAANAGVRDRISNAEPEAREAARSANPVPVIRASSFPGVDQ